MYGTAQEHPVLTVSPGKTAYLCNCILELKEGSTVVWYQNGTKIAYNASHPDRFVPFTSSTTSTMQSLMIKDVRPDDQNVYECRVEDEYSGQRLSTQRFTVLVNASEADSARNEDTCNSGVGMAIFYWEVEVI